ncbi:hypothetical protein COT72_02975 [archaeon CG10_big_fil_rev_8_21_14_0_10_43_11]|nr:MAG: hypothetical protein COT72_02975 [archaeon CG10_big_fil_rev_8_21_14_0_10_43_11]
MTETLPEEDYFVSGHTSCTGCGVATALRAIGKTAGENTLLVHATDEWHAHANTYPKTAWRLAWVYATTRDAPSVVSGIDLALKLRYDAREKPNVLVIASERETRSHALASLADAMNRDHDFCYVCILHTPITRTTTKNSLALTLATQGCRYVATTSIANLADVYAKVQAGMKTKGPSFVLIYAPCPYEHKSESDNTIRIARAAVETGLFPVYEIVQGSLKRTERFETLRPINEYMSLQARLPVHDQTHLTQLQAHAAWIQDYIRTLEEKGKLFV